MRRHNKDMSKNTDDTDHGHKENKGSPALEGDTFSYRDYTDVE